MANSGDPDQTVPIGAVWSGSILFASILNSSVVLGNYLQQTTSADHIFKMHFFLGALRVNFSVFFYTLGIIFSNILILIKTIVKQKPVDHPYNRVSNGHQ